jgi:hypothetical protein
MFIGIDRAIMKENKEMKISIVVQKKMEINSIQN